jgi:hypothetical protein
VKLEYKCTMFLAVESGICLTLNNYIYRMGQIYGAELSMALLIPIKSFTVIRFD